MCECSVVWCLGRFKRCQVLAISYECPTYSLKIKYIILWSGKKQLLRSKLLSTCCDRIHLLFPFQIVTHLLAEDIFYFFSANYKEFFPCSSLHDGDYTSSCKFHYNGLKEFVWVSFLVSHLVLHSLKIDRILFIVTSPLCQIRSNWIERICKNSAKIRVSFYGRDFSLFQFPSRWSFLWRWWPWICEINWTSINLKWTLNRKVAVMPYKWKKYNKKRVRNQWKLK